MAKQKVKIADLGKVELKPVVFKSGKKGYRIKPRKIFIGNKRYQLCGSPFLVELED